MLFKKVTAEESPPIHKDSSGRGNKAKSELSFLSNPIESGPRRRPLGSPQQLDYWRLSRWEIRKRAESRWANGQWALPGQMRCISTCISNISVSGRNLIELKRLGTKGAFRWLGTTVGQMTSGPRFSALLIVALILALVAQTWADEFDLDYSNEYDDVRPHLVYPDDPRLDKRIGDAAREFGQNITQAWNAMVDSFKNYFEELKNLFSDTTDLDSPNEVFSNHWNWRFSSSK